MPRLAAAALGGAAVAASVASAPAWLTIGAAGILGGLLYVGLNEIVDMDQLKQDVADGLRAWDGIATNAATIAQVGAQRVGEAIADTGESVAESVSGFVDNLLIGGS